MNEEAGEEAGKAGASFKKGGAPDGYVTMDTAGRIIERVSYADIDRSINQDLPFLGQEFQVPERDRTYAYYERAEEARKNIKRLEMISETKFQIISNGKAWEVEAPKEYRIVPKQIMIEPTIDLYEGTTLIAENIPIGVEEEGTVYKADNTRGFEGAYLHLQKFKTTLIEGKPITISKK